MKSLLLASSATVTLLLSASAAMAGDIGLAGATYDWAGGYVGVNAGASLNNTDFRQNYSYTGQQDIGPEETAVIDGLDSKGTANESMFTAGILAGYNWQYGNIVLGGEADFNYLGISGTIKNDVGDQMSQVMAPENTTATDKIDYEANWYGTVRARLGYAMNNVLIYGTAGLAYGEMDINQKLDATNGDEYASWSGKANGWNLGWVAGAGIEYGIDRWSLGAEYQYVNLNSYEWSSKADVSLADSILNEDFSQVKEKGSADLAFSVARATLKYRF